MNKKTTLIAAAVASAAVGTVAFWQGLRTVKYTVRTDKITGCIRAAVISDLHSTRYGKHSQNTLIDRLVELKPDVILIPGDTFDEERSPALSFTLLKQINRICPCFFVTGNHEYYGNRPNDIMNAVADLDIDVLCGDALYFTKGDDIIQICGLEDRQVGEEKWQEQKAAIKASIDKDFFTVLVSHRPDMIDDYNEIGADITVCGHAHGGQAVLPWLINGVFAPNQGLFPKYAGGHYSLGETEMYVSRGLMRNEIPRIFNPPELVIIDIIGKTDCDQ